MYSKSALCRQPTSVGPGHDEQFINAQMSILALHDTGPIMLRRYHLCHWKDILVTDTPPPEINLRPIANMYLYYCSLSRPKLCIA